MALIITQEGPLEVLYNNLQISDLLKAEAGTAYYVDSAGDDSTGDGSVGSPWATLNYAVSQVPKNLNSLSSVSIVVNDGTYNSHDKVEIKGFFNGMLQIYSSGYDPDGCIINFTSAGAGTHPIHVVGCTATIYIAALTLNVATNNKACIYAEHATRVYAETIDYGTNGVATGTYGVWANYGSVVTVESPADAGANVVNTGIRSQGGSVVQLVSPTAFGTTFLSQSGGLINEDSSLYSAGNIGIFPNNVTSPVISSSNTAISGSLFKDEDDMASDDAGALCSQQSIKAYTDLHIKHSLATAANDFLVASGVGVFVKKTLAETGAILEGDISHANIQGTHNLTTDIDHDELTNFAVNEHFTVASIDHGSISGLGDDDHTIYLLADGTRSLSGDWDAGAHTIQCDTISATSATGLRLSDDSDSLGIFIEDGGQVAIGHTNPGYPLDVYHVSYSNLFRLRSGSANAYMYFYDGVVTYGMTMGIIGGYFSIRPDTVDDAFRIHPTAVDNAVTINASGNLILGTGLYLQSATAFFNSMKSGATQGGAGAAAGELWYTTSHVSLPDYVVMIGV